MVPDMDALQAFTSTHRTHVGVFGAYVKLRRQMVELNAGDSELRLWHEVTALPIGNANRVKWGS